MSSDTKKTQFIQKKRSKTKLKTGKIPKKLNITEENKTGPWNESEDERISNWVAIGLDVLKKSKQELENNAESIGLINSMKTSKKEIGPQKKIY